MGAPSPAGSVPASEFLGHPRGLALLFATETWERFSYFGNAALLDALHGQVLVRARAASKAYSVLQPSKTALELLFGRLDPQPLASQLFGFYTGLAYSTPILGGVLADRVLGQRRTVIIGGVLMAIGHFLMTFEALFLIALAMLILGIGAFKPNISTQVGALYAPGDPRRDRAYSIFYIGISIGAFLAPLVCGTLAVQYGWHYGFAAAGIGMLASLAIYLCGSRTLPADTLLPAREPARVPLDPGERRSVLAIIGLCAWVALFWAAYDQQGNTLLLWVEDFTDRSIDLWIWRGQIPSPFFLSLNPLMIFVFAPLIVRMWAVQSRRGNEPLALSKMAFGCCLPRARQSADGAGGLDQRRQGEPAVAARLLRASHHRRAASGAGRARPDLQAGARAHGVDDDGHLVRDYAARRYSRRFPRRLLEQHGQSRISLR